MNYNFMLPKNVLRSLNKFAPETVPPNVARNVIRTNVKLC